MSGIYDVIVIGCGPTGAVLANLLGALDLRVLVLERDDAIFPIPRATHIDEETVRNLQATGLLSSLSAHYSPFGSIDFVGASRDVWFRTDVKEANSVHGHEGSQFFDQPGLEGALRKGLSRFPGVLVKTGVEVEAVQQTEAFAVVFARVGASLMSFQGSWVVGCDGAQSAVRKLLGVEMQPLSTPSRWYIVDALLKNEQDAALLPANFRYFLEERLSLYAHGFGRNRRWEFQLADGEEMSEESARRLIAKQISLERLTITRMATYTHRSLLAACWRQGRVFLAGDAAHLMPPFAGQGMCSGIRDAINLAWKLHLVIVGKASESLLDTYESERRAHAREVIVGSNFIGALLSGRTLLQRLRRRLIFWMLQRSSALRARMQRQSTRRPPLHGGFFDSSPLSGLHLPQFRIQRTNNIQLLDDVMGYQLTLIAKDFSLTTSQVEWANQHNISLYRPDSQYGRRDLWDWMSRNGIDYVLLRPDKLIASAGTTAQLSHCVELCEQYNFA
jgi:3-(3-hydroxy-phenyl)propionate hydroxylase